MFSGKKDVKKLRLQRYSYAHHVTGTSVSILNSIGIRNKNKSERTLTQIFPVFINFGDNIVCYFDRSRYYFNKTKRAEGVFPDVYEICNKMFEKGKIRL